MGRRPRLRWTLLATAVLVFAGCKEKTSSQALDAGSGTQAPAPGPAGDSFSVTVRDTEGRAFVVTCPPRVGSFVGCPMTGATPDVVPRSPSSEKLGDSSFFVRESRVLAVCDGQRQYVDGTKTQGAATATQAGSCRPVVCANDGDCPRTAYRARTAATCVKGLCEDPGVALKTQDVLSLCEAGEGVDVTGPEVARRKKLALGACPYSKDAPCAVPPECRQP